MKYLLLIYENEGNFAKVTEEEGNKIFAEYMDYTTGIRKAGNYVGGEALQPIAAATTVRQRNGKTLTTDGPFAETKEQLAGTTWWRRRTSMKRSSSLEEFPRSAPARSRCGRSCPPRRSSNNAPRRRPAVRLPGGPPLDVSISELPVRRKEGEVAGTGPHGACTRNSPEETGRRRRAP